MIIIVFGLPGSGKSYFALKLARRVDAEYLSSDVIRKQLFEVILYSREQKKKVYELMMKKMKKCIHLREDVVLDATFYKENIRKEFIRTADAYGERILFIEVRADQQIIFDRLRLKREYSDANYSVYLHIKKVFEPLKMDHLIVHSTQENIKEMVDVALDYILTSHG